MIGAGLFSTVRRSLKNRNTLYQDEVEMSERRVRLRVVRMANDDGSNQTAVTPANVTEWVREANLVFAPAELRILFDPTNDFETRRNTRLNELFEGSGEQRDLDAIRDAEVIGDSFRDRVVVICRTSRPIAPPPEGGCGSGCGFSGYPGKYVVMPAFDPNLVSLFAHEIGHYFGLPHTFLYVIDTTRDAKIVFDLLGRNLLALEGDSSVVNDTPPEIYIGDQNAGTATSIVMGGQTVRFLRDNIMSYYRPLTTNAKSITQGQVSRVQTVLQQRGLVVLQVTVTPHPIPINQAITVRVNVSDLTGTLVAGQVKIDGKVVANTNTPFSYTFKPKRRRISVKPPEWETTYPVGVVSASGYPDAPIDFGFPV